MAITINGSGTITGVSVGGLPDGIVDSGTLATNSVDSAELIDGAIDASHLASGVGGKVLQVISGHVGGHIDGVGQGNNVWTDTYITNSITPASTGSRILLMVQTQIRMTNSSGDGGVSLRFKQAISGGSTTYPDILHAGSGGNAHDFHYISGAHTGNRYMNETFHAVASPSTTSAVTFTLQYAHYNLEGCGVGTGGGCKNTFTLIEIGA